MFTRLPDHLPLNYELNLSMACSHYQVKVRESGVVFGCMCGFELKDSDSSIVYLEINCSLF